ncbi:carboxypeptidase regulatory-like domain-containing protein, partial [candidate division TA06 bacterium]|nr:carboxypeptidase regulatory-like domain-containing protein [candidate division TA06 bacterium]
MKWIVTTLFFLSLVIASSLMAGETGKISGRVVDEETGHPIQLVNITAIWKSTINLGVLPENLGVLTDEEGFYVIDNLIPGTYSIQARMIGYKDSRVDNVKVTNNQTTEVNFSLTASVIDGNFGVIVIKDKEVDFLTEDNVQVRGSFYPNHGENKTVIILLHMLSRNRGDWDAFAKKLQKIEYGVLTIDLRGHGESIKMGEKTLDFRKFSKEMYQGMLLDAKGAVEFLDKQEDVNTENLII